MPASSSRGMTGQTPSGVPDTSCTALWPWSCRVAGATSPWPAVEVYEAGSLLDVVSSTRLVARIVRGARSVRVDGYRRVIVWGRLPAAGAPAVEFGVGRRRVPGRTVAPVTVTSWCWLAVASGPYSWVTVSYGGVDIRHRLRVSRS